MRPQFHDLRIFTCVILVFLSITIHGQDIEDKRITVKIENKTFIEALEILEKEHGLSFSYDSKIIPKSKVVYTNVQDASLDRFLKALLNGVDLDYKIINDHIVLCYSKQPEENTSQVTADNLGDISPETEKIDYSGISEETDMNRKVITIYDTIRYVLNDTLIEVVYDTFQISIFDTIVIYDTVKVESVVRQHYQYPRFAVGAMGGGFFPTNPMDEYVFTIYDAEIIENYSRYRYLAGWMTGLFFEDHYANILFRTSIFVKALRKEIDLSFTSSSEQIRDYISDSYYEISIDTSWNDIYDQETVNEILMIDHKTITIKYFYLDIPVEAGYEFYLNKRFSASVTGGIEGSLLLSETNDSGFPVTTDKSIRPPGFYYSLLAGLNLKYKINNDLNISTQLHYINGMNFPLKTTTVSLCISKSFF